MSRWYFRLLEHPAWLTAVMTVLFALSALLWPQLRFDASSETLVVEGDRAFAEYQAFAERFPADTFVLLTYTPQLLDPFQPESLDGLAGLQSALGGVEGVVATLSVLDVPLMGQPDRPTLRQPTANLDQARSYFSSHSLFVNQLVSGDGRSLGVRVDLDPEAGDQAREQTLERIRELRAEHGGRAEIHIGGVPLIGSDMIRYVREDVRWFSVAAVLLITLALFYFFRRPRWVVLCLISCAAAIGFEVALLGALDMPVSVVSANFVSLLAIVAISFTVHLVVRYRELLRMDDGRDHQALVFETMRSKFAPCVYTALTTIVAFTSLLTSGIPPVEDFGLMMALGVAIALAVSYLVFPAVLLLLPKGKPSTTLGRPLALTRTLGRWSVTGPLLVSGAALVLASIAIAGVARLSLDSHFSQYFKPSSDIRQGLEFIDEHFGGVLPLDVVFELEPFSAEVLDEEDDFYFAEPEAYPESAWFTRGKVGLAAGFAAGLRERGDVGSVTAISDLEALGASTLGAARLDDAQLAVLMTGLGEESRRQLVRPLANPETGELRFGLRMKESTPPASYPIVLEEIRTLAAERSGVDASQVSITGMFVLFGQSIRSLFESQRNTIAYVLLATLVMFFVLLRSLAFAVIGIAANTLAATTVLAYMGYAGVPLDMMTITIAAICIGIGVDDAIHYLHRYREERQRGRAAVEAVLACHRSIGRAVYFTSVTVIVGFSVLVLSNFVPTIYFGVLTSVAMAAALVANLLLLPSLLVLWERVASLRKLPIVARREV